MTCQTRRADFKAMESCKILTVAVLEAIYYMHVCTVYVYTCVFKRVHIYVMCAGVITCMCTYVCTELLDFKKITNNITYCAVQHKMRYLTFLAPTLHVEN
jgi:hypothetical protein